MTSGAPTNMLRRRANATARNRTHLHWHGAGTETPALASTRAWSCVSARIASRIFFMTAFLARIFRQRKTMPIERAEGKSGGAWHGAHRHGQILRWGIASAASSTKATAALHSVEKARPPCVECAREAHVAVTAEAERRRVAGRAVGLGVGVDGAHVDEQRGEAADRRDEPLVGGLLLHLRALRRAEPHEVVGAVVVDVRQGPEVGAVVREGALPVRFERSPGASLGPWGRGGVARGAKNDSD